MDGGITWCPILGKRPTERETFSSPEISIVNGYQSQQVFLPTYISSIKQTQQVTHTHVRIHIHIYVTITKNKNEFEMEQRGKHGWDGLDRSKNGGGGVVQMTKLNINF